MALTLVSLNIERSKHLDLVEQFLMKEKPDVTCVQELMENDIERISHALPNARSFYVPMAMHSDQAVYPIGIGVFSSLPMRRTSAHYYVGEASTLRDIRQAESATYNNFNRMLAVADIENDGETYQIATTHFTWTPDGTPDEFQRRDMKGLINVLGTLGEFVLCGDFNAPRGGEMFAELASRYKDNIPPEYKTSLNASFHRSGKTRAHELVDKMVDGIFSTPTYDVSGVRLVSGVSDHCAIVATVSTGRSR